MKNLKKVLSLVLALAMALSLMTVAFAKDASDYNDYDEVTYKEAVDVMTAAGIFDGMGANNFQPDGTLTREQAAKIITYMLMGKSNADKLTTTIAPYGDVSADRWSAGAIAYCTNEGIISGMGHNKFAPTDEVTGLQFAKMLLVALGYDAEIEEMVGDSWAINTSKLAIAVGLDNGMEDVALSGALTRAGRSDGFQRYEVPHGGVQLQGYHHRSQRRDRDLRRSGSPVRYHHHRQDPDDLQHQALQLQRLHHRVC